MEGRGRDCAKPRSRPVLACLVKLSARARQSFSDALTEAGRVGTGDSDEPRMNTNGREYGVLISRRCVVYRLFRR